MIIPVRQEGYKFCQEISIPCYQTDINKKLRPAGFMDIAQEIAQWAADMLGFGYDTLHVHHIAWVLSRMHFHFEKPVIWRDTLKVYTWHKGFNGPFYLRDFQFFNEEGELSALGTSSWVVLNEETRHMVRPEELADKFAVEDEVDNAIETPAPKLMLPKGIEMEAAGTHVVAWSDIDLIGHTNNVRYTVWAMDCLPFEEASRPVKDLYINFVKETKRGDTVELFRYKDGENWWVEGRVEGKSCFIVKLEY